jgi:hypothetical protein
VIASLSETLARYRWLVFYVFVVLVFAHETFSQFTAPHHTIYRLIASAMSVIGALAGAVFAWLEYREIRK